MVKVKALEWRQLHGEYVETYEATGIVAGSYRTFIDEDSAAGAIFSEWAEDAESFCMAHALHLGRFHGWDAAQAAAQANYNARILSAIEEE